MNPLFIIVYEIQTQYARAQRLHFDDSLRFHHASTVHNTPLHDTYQYTAHGAYIYM